METTKTEILSREEIVKLGLASVSSVFANFPLHPLDTVKIRMQIQDPLPDGSKKYKNMLHGIWVIS